MASSLTIFRTFRLAGETVFGLKVESGERLPLTVSCAINAWEASGWLGLQEQGNPAAPRAPYEPLMDLPPRQLRQTGLVPWTVRQEWVYPFLGGSIDVAGMLRFQLVSPGGRTLADAGWHYFRISSKPSVTPREQAELASYYAPEATCWIWPALK